MAASRSQADISHLMWESENNIEDVGTVESVYGVDYKEQEDALLANYWIRNPEYLRYVKVSAVALLKMIMHTRIMDQLEVRGYLEGKIWGNTIIVTDTYTEPYNVSNACRGEHIYTYFLAQKMNKQHRHRVAWYRSQPNYGCWLPESVYKEQLERQVNHSFILVVLMIDPIKTITAGKVCLAAFRAYPKGYIPSRDIPIQQPYLPDEMKEDFLQTCKNYYPLKVTYFKTELDKFLLKTLWNKYWIQSLGSSSYLMKTEVINQQIFNLSKSLQHTSHLIEQSAINDEPDARAELADQVLAESADESSKLVTEVFADTVKDCNKLKIFSLFSKKK